MDPQGSAPLGPQGQEQSDLAAVHRAHGRSAYSRLRPIVEPGRRLAFGEPNSARER